MSLRTDDRIEQLHFVAKACAPVVALASMLCEWSTGREQGQLARLRETDFRSWIGPLPPNKGHAIQLHLWAIRELVPEIANGLSNQTWERV